MNETLEVRQDDNVNLVIISDDTLVGTLYFMVKESLDDIDGDALVTTSISISGLTATIPLTPTHTNLTIPTGFSEKTYFYDVVFKDTATSKISSIDFGKYIVKKRVRDTNP